MVRIKVLPVYARFPDTFWSFKKSMQYIGKKAVMPPTGLATVLAMLPEDRFDIHRIIDINIEPLEDKQIKDSDIVFTSTMISQEDSHNEVIDRAKFFGKPVIAGGPFPTSYPERNNVDCIVSGEAEAVMPVFLKDLTTGSLKRVYDEKEITSSNRNLVQLTRTNRVDISQTPLPRWDLVDTSSYSSLSIQYSRGCPFDCEFCDITKLFGRESRTKTPEQMLREFDAVYDIGFKGSIFVVDDNFIGNKKEVMSFLPELKKWQQERGYPYSLFTEASMNLAWESHSKMLEEMVDAGFSEVFVGIESVDPEVLKMMHKTQNTKNSPLECVRKLQNAGLEVSGGFIVGADGEKENFLENLFEFIQEAGVVIPMSGLLTVLKNTNLYHRMKSEGRLRGDSHGDNTHHFSFNFKPQLDEEFLIEGYKHLIKKLFDDKNYYERCRVLLDNLGEQKSSRKVSYNEIRALGLSLFKQLFSRGGLEYAKFISEIALTNPKNFPKAISYAIKLDHFKDITHASLESEEFVPYTEKLYNDFLKTVRGIHQRYEGISERVDYVTTSARKFFESAERKYNKLHPDFRKRVDIALDNLKERVNSAVDKYKKGGLESLENVN